MSNRMAESSSARSDGQPSSSGASAVSSAVCRRQVYGLGRQRAGGSDAGAGAGARHQRGAGGDRLNQAVRLQKGTAVVMVVNYLRYSIAEHHRQPTGQVIVVCESERVSVRRRESS